MKKTTITRKGQVVIPAEIRKRHNIQPGQKFSVHDLGEEIRLIPVKSLSLEEARGWLKTEKQVSKLLVEARNLEEEHATRLRSL